MCIVTPRKLCLPWIIFQKHRFPCHYVSCEKKKANNVLNTLRRLSDLNLWPFFLFCASGLNCKNQGKSLSWNWNFKLVFTDSLLTIWHFQNGLIEHKEAKTTELMWTVSILDQLAGIWKLGPSFHKRVKFPFCSYQNFTENNDSQNGLIDYNKVKRIDLYELFQFWAYRPKCTEICFQSLKIGKFFIFFSFDFYWLYDIFKMVSLTSIWHSKM